MPEPLSFEVDVPLRWRDIDLLGHLNQSVYHELLEEARAGLLRELVRRSGAGEIKGGFVMRRIELDHDHEVRRDDGPVRASARVTAVGNSSLRLHQELRLPDGTLAAQGTAVLVAWDSETRGKRAITEAERSAAGLTASPAD